MIRPERRHELERKNKLPGFNTVLYNRQVWSEYNWSKMGEEWTDSTSWKNALVNNFINKYIKPGQVVLEIGPGGGRWTAILAPQASILHLVDITETTLELCRTRLAKHRNCRFHIVTDATLPFISDGTVDFVWSFDVFVHIAPGDTLSYIQSLSRIMKQGGLGVIHHPANGNVRGGFRSSVTNEFFSDALQANGFKVIQQTADIAQEHNVKHHNDTITVFERMGKGA